MKSKNKFICNKCKKEFLTYQALNAHKAVHKSKHIEIVKKQKKARARTIKEKHELQERQYLKKSKICPVCKNVIPFKKRDKLTCSMSCAAKYRQQQKTEIELKFICEGCGKETIKRTIYPKRTDKFCKSCSSRKNYLKNVKPKIPCTVCGEFNCRKEICEYYYNNGDKTLTAFGLDHSLKGTSEFIEIIRNCIWSILKEYDDGEIASTDLLSKYNVGYDTFLRLCLLVKIKPKTKSEANKIAYLRGRHPGYNKCYKTKWHTTWFGIKVFLRSGSEIEYAEKLDKQQIVYQVETKRFKYIGVDGREHVYISDFYLPAEHKIVEIKGSHLYEWNKENIQRKLDAVRSKGFKVELIVC